MFLGFFDYVLYQAGDENIELGSEELYLHESETKTYPVFPNPSSEEINFGFCLETGTKLSISIYDISGRIIETIKTDSYYLKGQHSVKYTTTGLSKGTYFIGFELDGQMRTEQFIVAE